MFNSPNFVLFLKEAHTDTRTPHPPKNKNTKNKRVGSFKGKESRARRKEVSRKGAPVGQDFASPYLVVVLWRGLKDGVGSWHGSATDTRTRREKP